jgi:hypothetical protein
VLSSALGSVLESVLRSVLESSFRAYFGVCNEVHWTVRGSVSNGSGPSLRVRVRVGTEPEPDRRSGSSIDPNCRFGYGSIDISLPV